MAAVHLVEHSGHNSQSVHQCRQHGATCTAGASAPWVSIGTIQIDCSSELPLHGATEVSAAGGSTLQNFLNGTYRFSLKTAKKQAATCEAVIFQYDTGVFFITADLSIK